MKKITLLLAILCLPFIGYNQLLYSKVKIFASNAELAEISNLGVTIDHGKHKADLWFITDLSSLDIEILEENSITHEILIEDVATYYAEHSTDASPKTDRVDCPDSDGGGSGAGPITPSNFELGSMGGYYTYEEYLSELDQMRAAYPDLITEKDGISDFETWEGRPIHWVKISDNPEVDEDEKEVMYTAIHHAREPMSLSQTIFYMWYVLENYGTDAEITYLVDNTEMYFVPMINPDGYKRNQTTNPGGGGMHRKNRNPAIGSGNKGVDLNRNYSYHWNEAGTSPDEDSDVFAGEFAFSEPETQAIKWFCENHEFDFAFNAHAHGNLLLFPIGWATDEYADDHDYFQRYSIHMAQHNGYDPVKATDLYPAAGDSDDWMYIDEETEIYAMTPEVGDDFWPPSSAIVPTCKEMYFSNIVLSHMPHIYGLTTDLESIKVSEMTGFFNYKLERLGLQDGPMVVSMTALTGIESFGPGNIHTLDLMEIIEDSISFELEPGISFGDEIKFVLHTDNGLWTKNDTITKSFGAGTVVFFDDCSDLFHWTGEWDLTNEDFWSPSNCITDSPYDDTYGNNVEKEIELDETFSFSHATYAHVNFRAIWEIENDFDYVHFMISTDEGDSWLPLCGKYTNTGVADQGEGENEPLYDGLQFDWVLEEIDLTDYLDAANVRFKFLLITDVGLQMDGFYFDDFTVYTDGFDDSGIDELTNNSISVYPNPASSVLNIKIASHVDVQSVTIQNELGQTVQTLNGNTNVFSIANLAEGIYYVQVIDGTNTVITKRFTVIR
ncbi:MAG: carboxypeptidase T [Crocinitomix sp.]|jgi:carboxypeptidase T